MTGNWKRRTPTLFEDVMPDPRERAQHQFSVYDHLDKRLRRELETLADGAKRKHEAVDAWQNEQNRAICEQHDKRCRLDEPRPAWRNHLYRDNQFAVRDGDSACSSIAVVAAYNFLKPDTLGAPTGINWSHVVRLGVTMWHRWHQTAQAGQHQTPWEAYNLTPARKIRSTMALIGDYGGHLDDAKARDYDMPVLPAAAAAGDDAAAAPSFLTLADAVALLTPPPPPPGATVTDDRRRAAAFTIRDSTVCLLYTGATWYTFDSHGGVREGHSTLVECDDAPTLCAYLRHKYPLDTDTRWLSTRHPRRTPAHSNANTFSLTLFAPAAAQRSPDEHATQQRV